MSWRSDQIGELVDPHIKGDFDINAYSKLMELSLLCVMKNNGDRPSITQVLQMFQKFQLEQSCFEDFKSNDNNEHNPYIQPTIPLTSSFESNSSSYAKGLELEITSYILHDQASRLLIIEHCYAIDSQCLVVFSFKLFIIGLSILGP
jgi:hypothetical protein